MKTKLDLTSTSVLTGERKGRRSRRSRVDCPDIRTREAPFTIPYVTVSTDMYPRGDSGGSTPEV